MTAKGENFKITERELEEGVNREGTRRRHRPGERLHVHVSEERSLINLSSVRIAGP